MLYHVVCQMRALWLFSCFYYSILFAFYPYFLYQNNANFVLLLHLTHLTLQSPPPIGCDHPPFTSYHVALSLPCVPNPSLFLCPVSSDLYKSLQAGSQVALPPHLQLAFSGKIWTLPPPSKACSINPPLFPSVWCCPSLGCPIRVEACLLYVIFNLHIHKKFPVRRCFSLTFQKLFPVQMSVKAKEETPRGRLYDSAGLQGTLSNKMTMWRVGTD